MSTKPEFPPESSASNIRRAYTDPQGSNRVGAAGLFETFLRRFKNLCHLIMILPMYLLGCIVLGIALAPALLVFETIRSFGQVFAGTPFEIVKYFFAGSGFAAGYFTYGFTLIFVAPALNFVMRTRLTNWRGPYYSLEAIRWYIHNGITYLVRYTFLEFITPTPFNLLFYRMMGMKIGKGTAINSTAISDPSLIELGERVTIGGSVTLVGHYGQGGYLVLAPVKIGNGVTIGLKSVVMGGVTIGDNARILPSSVVLPKSNIPANETWGGVPARKMSFSDLKSNSSGQNDKSA